MKLNIYFRCRTDMKLASIGSYSELEVHPVLIDIRMMYRELKKTLRLEHAKVN